MESQGCVAKVGIPRALGYYYLYPFYRRFLEDLGAEVVVSPPTTKKTLDRMEACPTDEPCVAVKLYFAHVEKLLELGTDYILSPVLVSMEEDNFCCPKFLGISDMVRNGLRIDEEKLLTPRIDRRLGPQEARKPFMELAARLGVTDREKVIRALASADLAQREFEDSMVSDGLTIPQAVGMQEGETRRGGERESGNVGVRRKRSQSAMNHQPLTINHSPANHQPSTICRSGGTTISRGKPLTTNHYPVNHLPVSHSRPLIGVIGHPYILYDMLSHDIVARLEEYGEVITAEMISRDISRQAVGDIPQGNRMWSFESHLLGAALHLIRNRLVDRIVLVGSFECGPESIIESYVESEAEDSGIPFLLLTIDEQTGEAGLLTRLEAFMDTSSARQAASGHKGGEGEFASAAVWAGTKARTQVVGFPSMGYLDIAIRAMLEDCGTECLSTPRTSNRSVELGSQIAPEFICFPFTATLGQMCELLEAGANTLFMVGGKGRCRLGWYAQVQEQILRKQGYDFEMIILDSPIPLRSNWGSFCEVLKRISGDASWRKIIGAFTLGYRKLAALDEAETVCRGLRAVERNRGDADKVFDRFVRRIERATEVSTIKHEAQEFTEAVRGIEVEVTNPLKVRIAGEIWVVLEHFVNQEIEKMLASREGIRVEVDRELSATHWFRQHVLHDPRLKSRERHIRQSASAYLSEQVGGHGQETVGSAVLAKQEGCDGMVHIFPFTCMPEIVAQNILVRVSEDLDLPILTFIVSEQTGEAGIQTRVEAFLDILEERRGKEGHG